MHYYHELENVTKLLSSLCVDFSDLLYFNGHLDKEAIADCVKYVQAVSSQFAIPSAMSAFR